MLGATGYSFIYIFYVHYNYFTYIYVINIEETVGTMANSKDA